MPPPNGNVPNRVRTEFSATLFSGDAREWVRYLSLGAQARLEYGLAGTLVHGADGSLVVEPDNPDSAWFCDILTGGLARLRLLAQRKPNVAAQLAELLLRATLAPTPIRVRLSRSIPTIATREVVGWSDTEPTSIVIKRGLMLALREALNGGGLDPDEALGLLWPVLVQVISMLAFPSEPRNRYGAKIDVTARLAYVAVNVLYDADESGVLVGTACGETVERVFASASGRERKEIRESDAYLRLLRAVSFVLRARPFAAYERELRIAAREYLDGKYMRLSLSGAMPDPEVWRAAMVLGGPPRKAKRQAPTVGRYGVATEDDLDAWLCVAKPLRDLGFVILRQVGVGDFGRVYEAHNLATGDYPARVALKVDKILGKKKRAILEAEAAMQVGRDLASAPHLIRMYDTGKLQGRRFTYHVLQLVDGETIDELVGSIENEHTSLGAPSRRRLTLTELRRELASRIGLVDRPAEAGAGRKVPFRFGLSPAMLMDLLTDMLMCLEEVHGLGYAMNDLKNDNMMISRRGQVKGIDLDSFSRIETPLDKYTDFLFLATSLVLVMLRAPTPHARYIVENWRELLEDDGRLRLTLEKAWPALVVESLSEGRVSQEELVDVLVRLILRSKNLNYAADPALFSHDISELVGIKQRLLLEDLVID